jgi:predicted amidohydrolase YtcJ
MTRRGVGPSMGFVIFLFVLSLGVIDAGRGLGQAAPSNADAIYYNATVVTMNEAAPAAQAVALRGDQILAVGSNDAILKFKGPATRVTDLHGATILPGFIDPHSHMAGYGIFTDTEHWIDVSSVNVYFKPPPDDPRCTTPDDPQLCFIPVQTQDDVIDRLKKAVARAQASPGKPSPVLAFNYDPSRLGASKGCAGVAFECPNFEDGKARETLDRISTTIPIYVGSESGHISYVNTPALTALNICGTTIAKPIDCFAPITNPGVEAALAETGQLNEDLSLYAIGYFQGQIFKTDPLLLEKTLQRAVATYAQHGYTLTQEGAADGALIAIYDLVTRKSTFPTTAAMLVYDATTDDFSRMVAEARAAKASAPGNPNLIIAALKSFADGSTQGYTAYLESPYHQVFPPYTTPLFKQPYRGVPDLTEQDLQARALSAHLAGFPLVIHQNGLQAVGAGVKAFEKAQAAFPSPGLRDVVLHAPLIDEKLLGTLKALGNVTVSFLMEDLYYYGLPECQQLLGPGPERSNLYPAARAVEAGLHVTLHSDSPVTPPDPLFAIWVAKTRAVQKPSWYPHKKPAECPLVMGPSQSISIAQGVKAFTVDAAWQYGLEDRIGSIQPGKQADLVFLSANPLSMEDHPDDLKTIRVLATVHRGTLIENPKAQEAPIWPG